MVFSGPEPPKSPLPMGESQPPSMTWFLGPTQVIHLNSILIGSVVFAWLMNVTNWHTDQHRVRHKDHAISFVAIACILCSECVRCSLNIYFCLSNAILTDYIITLVSVRVCVCLSTDRLLNDYVHNSLLIFTKFCMPLRKVVVSNAIVSGTNRK